MLNTFELNTFNYRVLILFAVIICKIIITAYIKHEPLRLFQVYYRLLSDKVCRNSLSSLHSAPHLPTPHKQEQAANNQQVFAGFIAIVVTLSPIALILWLFSAFIEVEYLWQGFLLYLAIGAFGYSQLSKKVALQLTTNKTYLVKQQLSSLLLRETENLSSMVLAKACIEMMLLKTLQQTYVTAFVFILAGPITAFSYRLLLEMHYAWNIKLLSFSYFGRYAALLTNLVLWFPVRIFSILILILSTGQNFILFWRLTKNNFFKLNNDLPIHLFSLVLEVRLGGVAMYKSPTTQLNKTTTVQANKVRKKSFNDLAKQPEPKDIILANNKIKIINIITIFLLIVMGVLNI